MATEKFILDDDDVFATGFDPSEDPLPSSVSELGLDGVPAQDQFYSRSAGYLSFVEDEFDDDDLKRELGIDRDDMYRGPKDFPDLSENPTPTPTEAASFSPLSLCLIVPERQPPHWRCSLLLSHERSERADGPTHSRRHVRRTACLDVPSWGLARFWLASDGKNAETGPDR